MTDITFTVEGARFAEDALLQFAEDYGPRNALNTLRTAMRNAIRMLLLPVTVGTPVDTGGLRDSIFSATRVPNRYERSVSRQFTADTVVTAEVGWRWRANEPQVKHAALSTEFGTVNQSPRPVLGPALAQNAERIANDVITQIDNQIQARARRFSRQQRRGNFRRR